MVLAVASFNIHNYDLFAEFHFQRVSILLEQDFVFEKNRIQTQPHQSVALKGLKIWDRAERTLKTFDQLRIRNAMNGTTKTEWFQILNVTKAMCDKIKK